MEIDRRIREELSLDYVVVSSHRVVLDCSNRDFFRQGNAVEIFYIGYQR